MQSEHPPTPLRVALSTLPALLVLLVTVVQGTSEILQQRMLALGEDWWPGYAELRFDPPPPECDPADFDPARRAAAAEDDALDDLLGDDPPAAADDALDDLLDDAPPAAADDDALDDLLDDDPPADDDDALLDDLLGDDGGDDAAAAAAAIALQKARENCEAQHARHAELQGMLTPTLRAYRATDVTLSEITDVGRRSNGPALVVLLMICAVTATALRTHISLRPVRSILDDRMSALGQLLVALASLASCASHYQAIVASGVERVHPWLPLVWAAGFACIALVSAAQLLRPDRTLDAHGPALPSLLTVPLYVAMGLIAAAWFYLFENHPAGISIYLGKITEHAQLYIQVGLFVWAGMLLKQSWMDTRFFDLLRPWRMAPELLAAVVVVASAVPTAYSGASGIFVIAAGGIIYDELRRSGARNQLALASTALSGSLGVVLSPCLLVVIVASLNKQVTTTMLFGAGRGVFLLTAVLFVAALVVTRRNPLSFAPPAEALPKVGQAVRALVPYLLLPTAVLVFYGVVLGAWLNEHNAAKVLLVVLLAILIWEGLGKEGDDRTLPRLGEATNETTLHIGALLALMAFSIAFGGVVERAEVMSLVPDQIGSPLATMAALTVMLVFIGMLMDPYGAVILVSATIAQVAYDNGIDPLHFWMVVLVAFELGYLTPPVALNHLLTRAVVGKQADEDDVPEGAGFWYRHERLLLPVTVMGTALVLVAFGPLVW